MKIPEKCPICGNIFIQAQSYGQMKIIRCLVKKCPWRIEVDPDKINRDKVENIYLRTTL